MSEIAKASDHIKPCNIEQSERHNRREADYIASLNPRILYVRTDLSHNNESYVAPDMKGISLQQHYDAIKVLVKQKTGRKMQEKKVPYVAKSGKTKERNGSSPIRESVVNIKPDTTMDDLQKYTERVHERWGVRAIQIHIHRDEGLIGIEPEACAADIREILCEGLLALLGGRCYRTLSVTKGDIVMTCGVFQLLQGICLGSYHIAAYKTYYDYY